MLCHHLRAERWYAVPKEAETAGLGGFLGLTGLMGRRVLKFDGAFGPEGCDGNFAADFIKKGRGWRRRLCRRVASLRSGGDSGCGAEGGGLPLRAMLIKSALRIYLSVSYGMIGILRIGSLRSPPRGKLGNGT